MRDSTVLPLLAPQVTRNRPRSLQWVIILRYAMRRKFVTIALAAIIAITIIHRLAIKNRVRSDEAR